MSEKINEDLVEEIIGIGNGILTDLNNSLESIDNTNRRLDETIFFHKSVKRTLRGMTWFGYFINLFTNESKLLEKEELQCNYVNMDQTNDNGIDILVNQAWQMNNIIKRQNKKIDDIEIKIEEHDRLSKQNLSLINKF